LSFAPFLPPKEKVLMYIGHRRLWPM
jgi:hypothetical protein